jgi:hypothetical protein
MKRAFLLIIFSILVLVFVSLYFIIPPIITVSESTIVAGKTSAIQRIMLDQAKLTQWWPAGEAAYDSNLHFNSVVYKPVSRQLTSIVFDMNGKDLSGIMNLHFIPKGTDSVVLNFQTSLIATSSPINRMQAYIRSLKLKHDFRSLLNKLKEFLSDTDNIYSYHIEKALVVDSTLVSTYEKSKAFPSTDFIYQLLDRLKIYADSHNSKQTGYPMLNVFTTDSSEYVTRVAIPVDRKLPDSGSISYRWMLPGGNILVAGVRGGPGSIRRALYEMQNYINDYQRVSPAIPFESLITDRRKEPDTNKWVTKIYYPVM